jgi:hypothetical protein
MVNILDFVVEILESFYIIKFLVWRTWMISNQKISSFLSWNTANGGASLSLILSFLDRVVVLVAEK